MKKTPLYEKHVELQGKMVPFAGYYMPVHYSTTLQEEHENVRNNVGIFDVSHMGEFIVEGKEALNLIQSVTTNDASKLAVGDAQYTCMPNEKGGIVDDMIIYKLEENKFMLVVNASNLDKDWNWISDHNKFDAKMTNRSDEMGILAVQGPKATDVLQKLTSVDLSKVPFYKFVTGDFAGKKDIVISATGYTGSGGFELYIPNEYMVEIWDSLIKEGKEYNILPAGLGARDTLRLEMGYCLYGNDINDTTSPIEAGLKWITKFKKEGDFPSKQLFIDQFNEGVKKKLVAFKMEGKRIPRQGYLIYNENEEKIGEVTSGTHSPSLDIPIGMGYVDVEYLKAGTKILVEFKKKKLEGEIVKLPFYKAK